MRCDEIVEMMWRLYLVRGRDFSDAGEGDLVSKCGEMLSYCVEGVK